MSLEEIPALCLLASRSFGRSLRIVARFVNRVLTDAPMLPVPTLMVLLIWRLTGVPSATICGKRWYRSRVVKPRWDSRNFQACDLPNDLEFKALKNLLALACCLCGDTFWATLWTWRVYIFVYIAMRFPIWRDPQEIECDMEIQPNAFESSWLGFLLRWLWLGMSVFDVSSAGRLVPRRKAHLPRFLWFQESSHTAESSWRGTQKD